jgi:hypothetical protein
MVRIVVEIDGLKQLHTIFPESIRQTLERIEHIFHSHGFTSAGGRGSYLVFQCTQGEVETSALLADSLEKCDLYLRNRKRQWNGYSMYVFFDDAEQEHSEGVQEIAAEMYALPEEEGIWLDERAARLLSERFVMRKRGGVYRILSGDRSRREEVRSFHDFFEELPMVDEGLDAFAPLLQSEEPAAFLIRGSDALCRERLTATLLKKLDGSMHRVYWLELYPAEADRDTAVMLKEAMENGFRSLVAEHLPPHLDRVWKDLEGLLDYAADDLCHGDILLLFELYLLAYLRYMESLLLPGLFICHRVEEYSKGQLELLAELCRRYISEPAFLPFFTSSEALPELLNAQCTTGEYDCSKAVVDVLQQQGGLKVKNGGVATLFLLYCRQVLKLKPGGTRARAILHAFFDQLSEEHLMITYALSYFGSVFPAEFRRELASALGLEQEELNLSLRELENYGVVMHGREIQPGVAGLMRPLGDYLADKGDYIRARCAELFPKMRPYIHPRKQREFVSRSCALGMKEAPRAVLTDLIEEQLLRRFDSGIVESIEAYLGLCGEQSMQLLSEGYVTTVRLAALLKAGRSEAADELLHSLFQGGQIPDEAPRNEDGFRLAVVAEYLWRSRTPEKALSYAKRALLDVQDGRNVARILQARILIGKVMLSLGRVDEALEYFRSAKGYTLEGPAAALDPESSAFIALTHFVLGDYSLSLGYIRPAREKAAALGRREWERYLLMLEGKLQFELGRYREASLIFEDLLLGETLYFAEARQALFAAWLYRSLIYRGYTAEGIRRLGQLVQTPEVMLFTAEGYLLDRDLERANELVEAAIDRRSGEERRVIPSAEQLAADGFACFENYLMQGEEEQDLLLRHMRALHGFLAFNVEQRELAEQEFETVLSDKKGLKLDPYRHIYFFFRTLSFTEARAEEDVQKLTLLSKAWQNLQKRAGRINDPEDRRSYLTQNYWNSKLFSMSKDHKLV